MPRGGRISKATKRHMGRVASLGCVLCKQMGVPDSPAEVHHLFDTTNRSDWLVAPLCPSHHRGPRGFHGMGQRAFEAAYRTSEAKLLALTIEALHGE